MRRTACLDAEARASLLTALLEERGECNRNLLHLAVRACVPTSNKESEPGMHYSSVSVSCVAFGGAGRGSRLVPAGAQISPRSRALRVGRSA